MEYNEQRILTMPIQQIEDIMNEEPLSVIKAVIVITNE